MVFAHHNLDPYLNYIRKDNMDRWKSRGEKSQRREEQKREDQRRERVRRKKMQVREKVESREILCFSNDLWLQRVGK